MESVQYSTGFTSNEFQVGQGNVRFWEPYIKHFYEIYVPLETKLTKNRIQSKLEKRASKLISKFKITTF